MVRLLLLHGMGGGLGGWDALAARLAPHLELWHVLLPWAFTGNPDWARERDVTRWVSASVDGVRRAAGRPVDLVVAHSFAANVVLELLAGSDLPAAAVLVAPFYRDVAADVDGRAVLSAIDGCYERVAAEIRQRIPQLIGPCSRLRFQQVYARAPRLDLESIGVPVFLIGGGDDPGATPGGIRLLAGRIPRARLEILDGCGHFPMIERPARLAEIIQDFAGQAVRSEPESRPGRVPS